MRKTGVNRAKRLPEYARTLNREVKEELSWKCPFEVYYERKPFRKDDVSGVSTAQYERRGTDNATQLNGCNTDYGFHLNPDMLENIIKTTVGKYPQIRQTLCAVTRFFKCIVNTLPLPQIYIPKLAKVANTCCVSVRKIINMNIINAKNWTNAWVSLVAYGYGWYGISKIYWRTRNSETTDLVHFSSELQFGYSLR